MSIWVLAPTDDGVRALFQLSLKIRSRTEEGKRERASGSGGGAESYRAMNRASTEAVAS
jgi:hypothetical protein